MEKEKKSAEGGTTFHLFAVNLLEKLVEFFKGIYTSKLLEFCRVWLSKIGHIAIIVAAVLGFLFALIFAIRTNSFIGFLYGIGWVLLVFVVQYTANKFLSAGDALIKNNPTQLSSQAFLDCFGFLALIGGVVVLILQIIQTIQIGSIFPLLWGLGVFIFLEFLAIVAFNPQDITLKIVKSNTAGQEAIGIITFFIKALMILVPIFFGVFIVIGTIMMLIAMFGLFGSGVSSAWYRGIESATQIINAALLPFVSYIIFALLYLCIDVIRSILSIPDKLDKLGKK